MVQEVNISDQNKNHITEDFFLIICSNLLESPWLKDLTPNEFALCLHWCLSVVVAIIKEITTNGRNTQKDIPTLHSFNISKLLYFMSEIYA